MVWILSIALCAIIGAAFGTLANSHTFGIVLGCLWGVYAAFNYTADKERTKDKGMFLTETKEYKKKLAKKKDKTAR